MKRLYTLTLISIGAAASVIFAGIVTIDKSKFHNDFVRIFPPHAADINSVITIAPDRVNLAGLSAEDIYLRDRQGVLELNLNSGDTTRICLDIPFGGEVSVNDGYFIIHHGSKGLLERGSSATWQIDSVFSKISAFTAVQMISPTSPIVRTMNISKRQNILTDIEGVRKKVLQKQVDGLLCTDGLLMFSEPLNQLIYLYRYRNQFIYLDTGLNAVGYGNTIDTTSVAKISVAESDGKLVMSKPPFVVNNDACIGGRYLFVQSNLVAKNELQERVEGKSVIDVYNLSDASYMFSFYIENYGDSKMQEFKVKGSMLVVLFDDALLIYELQNKYLPD